MKKHTSEQHVAAWPRDGTPSAPSGLVIAKTDAGPAGRLLCPYSYNITPAVATLKPMDAPSALSSHSDLDEEETDGPDTPVYIFWFRTE